MESIGEKIKEARMKKEITQQELSQQLNISRSAISNWESGRNYPDLETIVCLSDILGISLNKLLRDDKKISKKISVVQIVDLISRIKLWIMIPLFIIFLVVTGYLTFQENKYVHNYFSPVYEKNVFLEGNQKSPEVFEFSYSNNIFTDKEIISVMDNPSEVKVSIFEIGTDNMIYEFLLSPGRSHSLDLLQKNTNYLIKVIGEDGRYIMNFC